MDSNETLLNFNERVGTRKELRPSIARAAAMLVKPALEWRRIAEEEGGLKDVYVPYVVTIGFFPTVIESLLNTLIWGLWATVTHLLSGQRPSYEVMALALWGTVAFVVGCVLRLAFAKVLDLVGPSFNCRSSWVLWTRVLVYASTPLYLSSLGGWIPYLGWILKFFAFLWSIALLIQGTKIVMKRPVAEIVVPSQAPTLEKADAQLAEVAR